MFKMEKIFLRNNLDDTVVQKQDSSHYASVIEHDVLLTAIEGRSANDKGKN